MTERAIVPPGAAVSGNYRLGRDLRSQVGERLAGFAVNTIDDPERRRAAVAIVICATEPDGPASVLLTLRPMHLKRHANQFALPGGRLDDGETNAEAARRETMEELGLDIPGNDVLGRLDDYPTVSGFIIAPVVLWGGAVPDITPDPDEVAEVYRIPLAELDSAAIPVIETGETPDIPLLTAMFPSIGHQMFSPTAALLYQFREVALRNEATRVAHYGQPRFAWS